MARPDGYWMDVKGVQDFREALKAVPGKLRGRVLRNALAAGARAVRDHVRGEAPVLSQANARRAPFRRPGVLRKAISVRTSKRDRLAGNVGVFVNVQPLKAKQRSAKNPNDPFYWYFVNRGTKRGGKAWKFLQAGATKFGEALRIFQERVIPEIIRIDRQATKKGTNR